MVEITDFDSAKAWLETQDHQTRVWFAARCALRAIPALGSWPDATKIGLALDTLRATLISAAAATSSATEMTQLQAAGTSAYAALTAHSGSPRFVTAHKTSSAALCGIAAKYAAESASAAFPTSSAARSSRSADDSAESIAHRAVEASPDTNAKARFAANSADSRSLASSPNDPSYATYDSAFFAAYSAASRDANTLQRRASLWGDIEQPDGLRQGWEAMKLQWAEDTADWSFWVEWYERILRGDPMDWRLIFRIATEVTEEEWEAGQKVVAELIAEIRKDFEGPSLDRDALSSHLTKVVQFPEMHADAAESASRQIEQTIAQFKREAETNRLPDGFEAFEKLPSRFWQLSVTLRSDKGAGEKVAKLQAEVVDLNAIIQRLRMDLAEARAALADARLTNLEALQVRIFGERLQTTLTNVTLVGSLGVNTLLFLGIPPEDWNYQAIKEALQSTSQQMQDVEPKEATDALPPTVEI